MKYSITFRLRGPLGDAAAVEWTDAATPQASGQGWEPCVKLSDGDWRLFSYGATEGRAQHWRTPGPTGNIGLRYRLSPTGPWSAVSTSRKQITIVAVAPGALGAGDWSVLEPGTVGLLGVAAQAVAVECRPSDGQAEAWLPCTGLGEGRWELAGGGDLAGLPVVLRYRLEAAGPWSPASEDARILMPSGGGNPALPVLAVLLAAPTLSGAGRIGSPVAVAAGLWSGLPAPVLALQWCRDGAAIPGATGPEFVPGPAEDATELSCEVTASNPAGAVTAISASLRITYEAPVARGDLLEEIFDEGTGLQSVETAAAFTGESLRFAVTGAGATINAATGVVQIPTDAPVWGETVTVTASNSGGSAASGFMVTVEAAEPEVVETLPPAAGSADWALSAVSLAPGTHTGVFALSPALGAAEVQWLGLDVAGFATDADLAPHYNPTVALGNNAWQHDSPAGKAVHLRADGTALTQIRMRYRTAADGAWSPYSDTTRRLDAGLVATATDPEPDTGNASGWSLMGFRSKAEADQGWEGGCQEQFFHGKMLSKSDPSLLVAGQDMGGIWFSNKGGVNGWQHSPCIGLTAPLIGAVGVDPVDDDVWLCVGGAGYFTTSRAHQGIFRSRDKGRTWDLVQYIDNTHHQRVAHNMVYDPNTDTGPISGRVVYACLKRKVQGGADVDSQIWRSGNGGAGWTLQCTIPLSAAGTAIAGRINTIAHHTTSSGTLFACTDAGIWKSTNSGVSWTRITGVGGLPVGPCLRMEINPGNGNEMYALIHGSAKTGGTLWHTTNGGANWSLIATSTEAEKKIFVGHDGPWPAVSARTLFLVSGGGYNGPNGRLQYSHNGGATWAQSTVQTLPTPSWQQQADWYKNISDSAGGGIRPDLIADIIPTPGNPNKAYAHAKGHNFFTVDKGVTWNYGGEGFTGVSWGAFRHSFAPTQDPNRFAFGCWDVGMMFTLNAGRDFVREEHKGNVAPDGSFVTGSMHVVALHPTDPNIAVGIIGQLGGTAYLFRTTNLTAANPTWTRVNDGAQSSTSLVWHRLNGSKVYATGKRSVNAGASWVGMGGGTLLDTFWSDPDVLYARPSAGVNTKIQWSQDSGVTWTDFVNNGWDIGPLNGDTRFPVFAVHPTNSQIIFIPSSTGDLARYNRSTGQWKTNYNLLGLQRQAYPNMPSGFKQRVGFIEIDPNDANVGYVFVDATGYNTVWRSRNFQSDNPTWENVSYDLPRCYPLVIRVNPHDGRVFCGGNGFGSIRVLAGARG